MSPISKKRIKEALIKNRPKLAFGKSIFTSILKVSDKVIEKVREVGFLVNALGQNGGLSYAHLVIFGAQNNQFGSD